MLSWFRIEQWSVLNDNAASNSVDKITKGLSYKRPVLLSQLCILGIILTTLHLIIDAFASLYLGVLLDNLLIVVLLISYYINEKGHFRLANILLTVSLNVILLIYGCLIPLENGLYFLLFPLAGLYFVVFDQTQQKERFSLFAITIAIFFTLHFIHALNILTKYRIQEPDPVSYLLNFLAAMFMIYFAWNFITKANYIAEKRLKSQSDKIFAQNTSLEKANKELDKFVYSASHDMKAPVASIQGLINLMRMESPKNINAQYIEMMQVRLNQLLHYINDLTLFSENVNTALNKDIFSLHLMFQKTIESFRYYKNFHKIHFEIEPSTVDLIMADQKRIERIFNNIICNAISYHNFQQEIPYVKVSHFIQEDVLTVSIKDNGSGIDDALQPKIFDMFFRGHESSSGPGLGLYLVRELLNVMNGDITFTSKQGFGSEFTIFIPVKLVAQYSEHAPIITQPTVK